MRTLHTALFMATAMLLTSCVKEHTENRVNDEGSPVRISLKLQPERITDPMPTRAYLPTTRATPDDESLISNLHVLVFRADGALVSNEHFEKLNLAGFKAQSVEINTSTGNGMQIYVIANSDVNDDTGDTPLHTELSGVATLEQLQKLVVTLKGDGLSRTERLTMVGNTTIDITNPHTTPISIPLYYLAAKVTITLTDDTPDDANITIDGWDVVNIPKRSYLLGTPDDDAVDGSTAADYTTTTDKHSFETTEAAKWSHTFYCFENRRGGRVNREDPTDPANKYDGMNVGDDNQRGKAWYAPAGATCVLVYGSYTKDGTTNQVVYRIFLGANPVNDYNIERSKHYAYNVTIKGLNDINVDTNVEWGSASFSVDHSGNLDMDAHPDFRVFRIGGTAIDAITAAYATVEVFEANGSTPSSWLAVSPLNLYASSRPTYTPQPTAESTFEQAQAGMTRKLTMIPFTQPAVYEYQTVFVYADGCDASREGKVRVTYYKDAACTDVAGQKIYNVTQTAAIAVSENLFMENFEESAMLLYPGLYSVPQNTRSMQWGFTSELLYGDAALRYTNGRWLTANAVYTDVQPRSGMDEPVWSGGTPRPLWARSSASSDDAEPIFNSSAARYCHNKNRDSDGDGAISAAETSWYLPSFADLWHIAHGEGAPSGTYWSSTEESASTSHTYTLPGSTSTLTTKDTQAQVRCVRGTGELLPDATIESTEQADKTKINLASTAGASGAFNITDATGLPWTVSSDATSWLKIATTAGGIGQANTQTGKGNATLYAYAATENTSTSSARTGNIKLTRAGMDATPTKIVAVTQEIPVMLSPTTLTMGNMANAEATFRITCGANKNWTLVSNNSTFNMKDGSSGQLVTTLNGTGPQTITVVAPNKQYINRGPTTGTITENSDKVSVTITRPRVNVKWKIRWVQSNIKYYDLVPEAVEGFDDYTVKFKFETTDKSKIYDWGGKFWTWSYPWITPVKGSGEWGYGIISIGRAIPSGASTQTLRLEVYIYNKNSPYDLIMSEVIGDYTVLR